jgi:mercuric ion transport protein
MKDKAFLGASLLAALVASFCCILPIVFALAGMGIAGASAFFAAWRPYLLGLTFVLLGIGFYLSYRKRRDACEPGSACERPVVNRSGRVGLWLAAVFVTLFAAFPYYSGPVARLLLYDGKAQAQPASTVEHVSFAVEGMTCPVCAEGVAHKLKELPGVRQAAVSYEQHKAEIEYDSRRVPLQQLEKVFTDAGYRVRTI